MPNLREQVKEHSFIFFILWIATIVILLGCTFQFKVIIGNGGKMPVKYGVQHEDADHFTYQDASDVKLAILSDRIYLFRSLFSIGDLIIILGSTTFFILCVILIWRLRKKREW